MKIIYIDEYGNELFSNESPVALNINDNVVLDDEEYRIQSKTIYPQQQNIIVLTITQNSIKAVKESSNSGRQDNTNAAILALNKRQDASEKKTRALGEQIGSVRKHINQQIRKDNKDGKSGQEL